VTIGGIDRGKPIFYQSDLCLLEVDRFSGINFSAISWAIIGAFPPHRERAYPARKSSNNGWWASISLENAQDRPEPRIPTTDPLRRLRLNDKTGSRPLTKVMFGGAAGLGRATCERVGLCFDDTVKIDY